MFWRHSIDVKGVDRFLMQQRMLGSALQLIYASSDAAPRVARFGAFEFDPTTGDLSKGGRRIRLQEQPRHVLGALISRPGELVTREDFRSIRWPGDTFVDFDIGLNVIVNKVRQALGDSASSPRSKHVGRFWEAGPRSRRGRPPFVPHVTRSRSIRISVKRTRSSDVCNWPSSTGWAPSTASSGCSRWHLATPWASPGTHSDGDRASGSFMSSSGAATLENSRDCTPEMSATSPAP
jgi:hypothetical protein